MGAVDPPRELVERIADVLIGFDVAARGRRDLEQINARVPVRMLVEEALVTEEAFGEPLRIIDQVDADDQAAADPALAHALLHVAGGGAACAGDEILRVDSDRAGARLARAPADGQRGDRKSTRLNSK